MATRLDWRADGKEMIGCQGPPFFEFGMFGFAVRVAGPGEAVGVARLWVWVWSEGSRARLFETASSKILPSGAARLIAPGPLLILTYRWPNAPVRSLRGRAESSSSP